MRKARYTTQGVFYGPEPVPCAHCSATESNHKNGQSKVGNVLLPCEVFVPTWVGSGRHMMCGACQSDGKPSRLSVRILGGTLMAGGGDFYDANGDFHHHEINHLHIRYSCSNGHTFEREGAHIPCVTCMVKGWDEEYGRGSLTCADRSTVVESKCGDGKTA